MSQLPMVKFPYVAKFGFYKNLVNQDGELQKTPFPGSQITSPFYFLLEVREVENRGRMEVVFYDNGDKQVAQKEFSFGETGQYYEYILFFDKVAGFSPGKYRYAVFYNGKMIYEESFPVAPSSPSVRQAKLVRSRGLKSPTGKA